MNRPKITKRTSTDHTYETDKMSITISLVGNSGVGRVSILKKQGTQGSSNFSVTEAMDIFDLLDNAIEDGLVSP